MEDPRYVFKGHYKEEFDRAKCQDEPFVLAALRELGMTVREGTMWEDWKHKDLVVENAGPLSEKLGTSFSVDVKRVRKQNVNTGNFLITTFTARGNPFPFNEKNYFAFIDDIDQSIYIVNQMTVERLTHKYKWNQSKFDASYWCLLPKYDIKNHAVMHIHPSESVKWMLY